MSSTEETNGKLNPPETQDNPSRHSRRTFIQTIGTTVGSAMLAPSLNGATPESGYPQLAQLRDQHAQKGMILPDKTYRTM